MWLTADCLNPGTLDFQFVTKTEKYLDDNIFPAGTREGNLKRGKRVESICHKCDSRPKNPDEHFFFYVAVIVQ